MSDRPQKAKPSKAQKEGQPASDPTDRDSAEAKHRPLDATTGSEGGGPRVGYGGSPDVEEDPK